MLDHLVRRIITIIFVSVVMLFTISSEASTLRVVYPSNGLYSLQPMCAPTKELTVHNASTANGANVIIWDINSNWHTQKSHQKWNIQRIGNTEWYKILAENSGSALNIHNGIAADGTNVSIWPFGGNMHKFRFLDAGNGYYVLQGNVNGTYVLDVSGASNTNGANVQIWKYNASSAQKWKLVKRSAYVLKGDVDSNGKVELADLNLLQKYLSNSSITINKNNSDLNSDGRVTITDLSQLKSKLNQNNERVITVANGWYNVASANYLKRGLDVNCSGTAEGSNIILYNYEGQNNQKFYLENKGSGWFTLKAGHCDKYVSAANNTGANHTNIQINSKNNGNDQLWRLIDAGSGYYYIESKLRNGLSFDCANCGNANGTNIQLWDRANVLWNKWKFTKVSAPQDKSTSENDLQYWESMVGKKISINLNSEYYKPQVNGKNPFKKSYTDKGIYHATNCTWYAIGRFAEVNGQWLGVTGGPGSWANQAKAKGFNIGTTPRSKCVGATSKHVYFVEFVNGNDIYITEVNVGGDSNTTRYDYIVRKRSVSELNSSSLYKNSQFIYPK